MIIKTLDSIEYQADSLLKDICGFWEVTNIRDQTSDYSPTIITRRDKYIFLEEMLFVGVYQGKPFHGSWKLSEPASRTPELPSIILEDTFEYEIIHIGKDDMVLSDLNNEYLLVRRL